MTYANDVESARAALADLGVSPAAIANALTVRGIRGRREDKRCCPVVNYLARVFPDSKPELAFGYITLHGWPDAEFKTPDPIDAFVYTFDGGAFPELVDADR